jgi:hypothetical protein
MLFGTERYLHERERHDLALRLIRHEARTCTIRACTGLSDDRIRRLYRCYIRGHHATLRRRRGKAPRRVGYFTRNPQVQFESSLLASLFMSFGLLRAPGERARSLAVERTRLFCDAYETYRQLLATSCVSIEHAWFLLQVLLRAPDGLQSVRCRRCDSHYLREHSGSRQRTCPLCRMQQRTRAARRRTTGACVRHAVPALTLEAIAPP